MARSCSASTFATTPRDLHAAYNDSRGVTAAFNLNLLARLNRELDADFDLGGFEHSAVYDEDNARIEMRLVSRRTQEVSVAGVAIPFRAGEHIVSEHSHKYAPHELTAMASAAAGVSAARGSTTNGDSASTFCARERAAPCSARLDDSRRSLRRRGSERRRG